MQQSLKDGQDLANPVEHNARNPTAIVFGAIDPVKGILYIYQEYYKPNTLVPDHAKALKPLLDEIPHGRLRFMVGDPSIKNKTDFQTGKSVQGLYQEYGIYWSLGNNNIEAGILKVNSYIERGRLKVFDTCPNVIREHLHYKFPEITMDNDKNLDEKPEKKNEHSCDALRYLCMRLPDNPDMLNSMAYEAPTRYNRNVDDEFEYNDYNGKSWLEYA